MVGMGPIHKTKYYLLAVFWFLALLIFPAFGGEGEEASKPSSWILGTDSPEKDSFFPVWLHLGSSYSHDEIELEIMNLEGLQAFWTEEDCNPSLKKNSGKIKINSAIRILKACGKISTDRPVKFIALIRKKADATADAESTGNEIIIASESLQATHRWLPTEFPTALVAGVLSFFAGLLSSIIPKFLERYYFSKKTTNQIEAEFTKTVTDALLPELNENRRRLEEFINTNSLPAPTLQNSGYNTILGDNGVISFLKEKERQEYWPNIVKIYEAIQKFNSAGRGHPPLDQQVLQQNAKNLRNLITNEISP